MACIQLKLEDWKEIDDYARKIALEFITRLDASELFETGPLAHEKDEVRNHIMHLYLEPDDIRHVLSKLDNINKIYKIELIPKKYRDVMDARQKEKTQEIKNYHGNDQDNLYATVPIISIDDYLKTKTRY
jgi:hypothetical protein